MSILDEIEAHCKTGALVKFESMGNPREHRKNGSAQRDLYLASPIQSFLQRNWPVVEKVRSLFSDFVSGEEISVALYIDHHGDCLLARLEPPEKEIWEIRIYDDNSEVHYRFFGRFAARNTLVVLNGPATKWLGGRKISYAQSKK